jgi:hypothetical protein
LPCQTLKYTVLISAALTLASPASAEAQLWSEAGLRYRPGKAWALGAQQQLRFDQDLSRLGNIISDLTLAWRPKKWLRLGIGYRYEWESSKKDERRTAQRGLLQAQLKKRLAIASFSYRLRLQQTAKERQSGIQTTPALRHRLSVSYAPKTLVTPSLAAELYTRFVGAAPTIWHKLRLTAAAGHALDKTNEIEVFLRLQIPLADPADPVEQILGLAYRYTIKS